MYTFSCSWWCDCIQGSYAVRIEYVLAKLRISVGSPFKLSFCPHWNCSSLFSFSFNFLVQFISLTILFAEDLAIYDAIFVTSCQGSLADYARKAGHMVHALARSQNHVKGGNVFATSCTCSETSIHPAKKSAKSPREYFRSSHTLVCISSVLVQY